MDACEDDDDDGDDDDDDGDDDDVGDVDDGEINLVMLKLNWQQLFGQKSFAAFANNTRKLLLRILNQNHTRQTNKF
jgi:hypothetical protein